MQQRRREGTCNSLHLDSSTNPCSTGGTPFTANINIQLESASPNDYASDMELLNCCAPKSNPTRLRFLYHSRHQCQGMAHDRRVDLSRLGPLSIGID